MGKEFLKMRKLLTTSAESVPLNKMAIVRVIWNEISSDIIKKNIILKT